MWIHASLPVLTIAMNTLLFFQRFLSVEECLQPKTSPPLGEFAILRILVIRGICICSVSSPSPCVLVLTDAYRTAFSRPNRTNLTLFSSKNKHKVCPRLALVTLMHEKMLKKQRREIKWQSRQIRAMVKQLYIGRQLCYYFLYIYHYWLRKPKGDSIIHI